MEQNSAVHISKDVDQTKEEYYSLIKLMGTLTLVLSFADRLW